MSSCTGGDSRDPGAGTRPAPPHHSDRLRYGLGAGYQWGIDLSPWVHPSTPASGWLERGADKPAPLRVNAPSCDNEALKQTVFAAPVAPAVGVATCQRQDGQCGQPREGKNIWRLEKFQASASKLQANPFPPRYRCAEKPFSAPTSLPVDAISAILLT